MQPIQFVTRRARRLPLSALNRPRRAPFAGIRALLILTLVTWAAIAALIWLVIR
jgi:hypothetical protein